MCRNQALPLLPDQILGTKYVKQVPNDKENIKVLEYPAVPL
jgi:hypothetical protein